MAQLLRLLLILLLAVLTSSQIHAQSFPKINPANVTIARDSFGIPHIFAKTDAEVAYGLAWANAEDAFQETQNLIYVSKGYMGRADGIDGVKADFFVHAIAARKLVEERFDSDVPLDVKKYLDGYTQGVNAYAAAHRKEVKVKKAFPCTTKDMVTAFVIMMSFMSRAQDAMGDAISGKYDTVTVTFPKHAQMPVGSNAFALNSTKTVDGKTYICINPHMGMDGALSFYEAHLQSEEGLNIEGPLFQGTSSANMGVNDSLGWGMTWNHFDRLDEYKLKMKSEKSLEYEMDGEYYKLEKRPVWLKVGLGKKHKIVLPVRKMTYWSKYGCTVKSGKSNSYYSLRFPGNMSVKTAEQVYRMNKAHNYKEFWDAINIHAIVLFNIVYADKDDNIFYLEHGTLPDRDTSFNYEGLIPGNTSKNLWTKLIPLEKMPQNINPTCGYVYNTNNSPFNSSGKDCNATSAYPPRIVDGLPGNNNRATRFMELISEKSKFTLDDLRRIKFDVKISHDGGFGKSIEPLFHLDESKYPDVKEALQILKSWNRAAEATEYAPTILGLMINDIFNRRDYDDHAFVTGFQVDESEWVSTLRRTCDTLKAHFGTVKVEWGTVQRNIRGNVNLPLRGFPDVLTPMYPRQIPGTFTFKPRYGDTYTMFASFSKKGVESLSAVEPTGNSLNPNSKHYNDQMELFGKQQLRTLNLNKDYVLKHAEAVYHPQ